MRVDSHHHFWDYSAEEYGWINDQMAVLRRDFGPGDLQSEIDNAGVDAVVSVQARQTIAETEWLIGIAEQAEIVHGVVGWVPLADKHVAGELERLTHSSYLKSVRHVVQDEPDDDFILGADFGRGISLLQRYNLVYDILIFAKHLPNTIEFVDRHPQQPFVLDHIAKPTIRSAQFDDQWADNIRLLAQRQNVSCKFSGVATEVRDEEWSVETIRPYWDVALEAFGSRRLMYGSDWPVCLLRTGYSQWVQSVESLASELSDEEQIDFWGENAQRAYRLID